jgi:hypothetical protein
MNKNPENRHRETEDTHPVTDVMFGILIHKLSLLGPDKCLRPLHREELKRFERITVIWLMNREELLP